MSDTAAPRKKLRLSILVALLLLIGLAVIAGELVARFYLGLGTPPLSQTHPTIEYLFQPNQEVNRFGNRIKINAYGMRSEDFPPRKTTPDELRIMVYGDSVINGGNLTDQRELATSIVQRKLQAELGREVIVGNISAGSWGPQNVLAHLETYGTFDADVIVLVMNSHDIADLATFEPLNPSSHPQRRPVTALTEGAFRYLPRYLPSWQTEEQQAPPGVHDEELSESEARDIELALKEFFIKAKQATPHVFLLLHWGRDEAQAGESEPRQARTIAIAEQQDIPVISMGEIFQSHLEAGNSPYRDGIHPNALGQRLMAEAVYATLRPVLESPVRKDENAASD